MGKMKLDKGLTVFCIAIALFILALIFDAQIISLIALIKNPGLDTIFSWLLFIQRDIIFYPLIILITSIILFPKERKKIHQYIFSLVIVAALGIALKFIVDRPRPNLSSNHSFPSGHSLLLFTSLSFFKNKTLRIIWFIFSCLLLLARVWFNLHYPSDIIAGAIIGYYAPLIIHKFVSRKHKMHLKEKEKREK